MNDVQSLLLQVIGAALFGKKAPTVADNQILPLINESKAQSELNEDTFYCAISGIRKII